MRILLLILFPFIIHAQPVFTLKYSLKEVHTINTISGVIDLDSVEVQPGLTIMHFKDSLDWKVDTVTSSVQSTIRFTKTRVVFDEYGRFEISTYEDRSNNGTRIDYWALKDGSTITKIDAFMYWEYPFVHKKSKMYFFKIE